MPRIGQYELVAELGRGGMGVVYRGFDPLIRRDVAIKTIRLLDADPSERAHLEERLAREAQSAGRMSHPNIVTIYQIGYESLENGQPMAYIVMEYVAGQTLGQRLTMSPALDREAILNILGQTAEALDYAHSQGVIHRDVKPANLLLSQDGRVKVADFGIAKVASQTMTQTGTMMGSPQYMAPEQVRAEALDGRADQYSLAVVAFELLTGQRPFTADTMSALVYQIAHQETPTESLMRAGLSPVTIQVIRKAMAKQPRERYPSCREMVVALRASFNAPVYAAPAAQGAAVNWAGWAAGLTIPLLLMGAGAGWFVYRGGRSAEPASPPIAQMPSLVSGPAAAPRASEPPRVSLAPAVRAEKQVPAPMTRLAAPAASTPVAQPVKTVVPQAVAAPAVSPAPTPVLPPPAPVVEKVAEPAREPVREPVVRTVRNPPSVVHKVDPVYTESARRAGVEGTVSMRVRVTPTGSPEQIEVVKGLEPTLDQRAVEALSQWRFNPGTAEDGTPMYWTGVVQVTFRLLNAPKAGAPSLKKK